MDLCVTFISRNYFKFIFEECVYLDFGFASGHIVISTQLNENAIIDDFILFRHCIVYFNK